MWAFLPSVPQPGAVVFTSPQCGGCISDALVFFNGPSSNLLYLSSGPYGALADVTDVAAAAEAENGVEWPFRITLTETILPDGSREGTFSTPYIGGQQGSADFPFRYSIGASTSALQASVVWIISATRSSPALLNHQASPSSAPQPCCW